jgi:hypothetical protein
VGAHEAAQGDQRQDAEALWTAGLRLRLPAPGGPRVTRNGGGIGSPLRPMLQVTLGPADLTAGARQDPVEFEGTHYVFDGSGRLELPVRASTY